MAICIVERWKKTMSYRFVSEWTVLFIFFCLPYLQVHGFWDPEILLPWQHDVTTSPLYCPLILWLVAVISLQKRSGERGSNSSVLQRTLDTREKIYYHQVNLDNSYSNARKDVCISSGHRGRFSPLKYLCKINDKHNCHVEILNANQRFRKKKNTIKYSCLPTDDSITATKKEGRGEEGEWVGWQQNRRKDDKFFFNKSPTSWVIESFATGAR